MKLHILAVLLSSASAFTTVQQRSTFRSALYDTGMDAYDAQMRAASGGPPADPAPVPAAHQIVPTAAEAAPSAPNVVDGFNDVFGEHGRGNLIERKGVFQVQGGGLVDRAVVAPHGRRNDPLGRHRVTGIDVLDDSLIVPQVG